MFRIYRDNWKDKDFVLSKVKQNGMDLEYASSELKKDYDVVFNATTQNIEAVLFVNKKLLKDPAFFFYILNNIKKGKDSNLEEKLQIFLFAHDTIKKNQNIISDLAKLDMGITFKVIHYTILYDMNFMFNLWNTFNFSEDMMNTLESIHPEVSFQLKMEFEDKKGYSWQSSTPKIDPPQQKKIERKQDIETKKTNFSYLFKNNISRLAISLYKGQKNTVTSLFKLYSYIVDIRSNDIEEANLFRGRTLPLWKAILKEQSRQFTPDEKVTATITQSLQVIDNYFKNNTQPLDSPSLQQEKVTLYKASRYKNLIVNLLQYMISFFGHLGIKVKPLKIVSDVSNIKVIGLMADTAEESPAVSQLLSQVSEIKDKLTQNLLRELRFNSIEDLLAVATKDKIKGIEYFEVGNLFISLDTLKSYPTLELLLADVKKEKIIDKNYSQLQVSQGKIILRSNNKVIKTITYFKPEELKAKIKEYQNKIDTYNSSLESYEKKLSNPPKIIQLGDHQVNTVKILDSNISRLVVVDGLYQGHFVDELVSSTGEVIGSVSKASAYLTETSKVLKTLNKSQIESVFSEPIEFSNLQKISDYVSPKNLDTVLNDKYLDDIDKMSKMSNPDIFHNIVGNSIIYNMKYDLSDTRSYLSKENSCLTNVTEVEPEHNDGTYMKIIRNIFWDDLGKPKYIYNKLFETTSCLPDGLGTRIFTQQVKSASEEGFKYIETYAGRGGIYKGYHIWPKLGYNAKVIFDLDSYIDSDLVALGKYLKKWLEKNSNSYTASKGNSFSANILDVYACKAGKRFVGQELWKFIGESTDMKFDLNPSSLSMRILETYVTLKAKKEGIDPKDYLNIDYARFNNYNLECLLRHFFENSMFQYKDLERRLEDSIRNYENGELFRIYQNPDTRKMLVDFLKYLKDIKPKVVEDAVLVLKQKGYEDVKFASNNKLKEDPMIREVDFAILDQVWDGVNKLYESGNF